MPSTNCAQNIAVFIHQIYLFKGANKTEQATSAAATKVVTTKVARTTAAIQGNMTTAHPSTQTTVHKYVAPHFGGMLKRLVYVVSSV